MRHLKKILTLACSVLLLWALSTGPAVAQITQIIDQTGDGAGRQLLLPSAVAVDGAGNVYVASAGSIDNAFKITPSGVITEIINRSAGGAGSLNSPSGIAVDGFGNVYVVGELSSTAFKITPGGVITKIIDATGDGAGNGFFNPLSIAADGAGNAYPTGTFGSGAFKITPSGVITQIIDGVSPSGITVDGAGNVYVAGAVAAFKITPSGVITEIIDMTGGFACNELRDPSGITVDSSGNVYLIGEGSNNAFKIPPTTNGTPAPAPVAVVDAYGMIVNTQLTVAAPGVLVNDLDVDDGAPLTAAISIAGPAKGTLILNADGSFIYTPNVNFIGTDSFFYRASSDAVVSKCAKVTLSVDPVPPPAPIAFVANNNFNRAFGDGIVAVVDFDGLTLSIVDEIFTGRRERLSNLAITPDGQFLYVPISSDDEIHVIKVAAEDVVETIPAGDGPRGIVITPDGKFAYVSNRNENTVQLLDLMGSSPGGIANTFVQTIASPFFDTPRGIAITPDGSHVYVANIFSELTVIETASNTVVAEVDIPAPFGPWDVTTLPFGQKAYTGDGASG